MRALASIRVWGVVEVLHELRKPGDFSPGLRSLSRRSQVLRPLLHCGVHHGGDRCFRSLSVRAIACASVRAIRHRAAPARTQPERGPVGDRANPSGSFPRASPSPRLVWISRRCFSPSCAACYVARRRDIHVVTKPSQTLMLVRLLAGSGHVVDSRRKTAALQTYRRVSIRKSSRGVPIWHEIGRTWGVISTSHVTDFTRKVLGTATHFIACDGASVRRARARRRARSLRRCFCSR